MNKNRQNPGNADKMGISGGCFIIGFSQLSVTEFFVFRKIPLTFEFLTVVFTLGYRLFCDSWIPDRSINF